jgi:LPXTG-motif cell wall-anchored protein
MFKSEQTSLLVPSYAALQDRPAGDTGNSELQQNAGRARDARQSDAGENMDTNTLIILVVVLLLVLGGGGFFYRRRA